MAGSLRRGIAYSLALATVAPMLSAAEIVPRAEGAGFEIRGALLRLEPLGEMTLPDRTVTFTDRWFRDRRSVALSGSYHVEVDREIDGAEPWALFIPSYSGRLTIYWNDQFVGRSPPGAGGVSGPMLVRLPSGGSSDGPHTLRMAFETRAIHLGFVRAPIVAPLSDLEMRYANKRLTLIYLPLGFGIVCLLVAVAFFAVYSRDPSAGGAGWLTLGLIASAVSVIGIYLPVTEATHFFSERIRPTLFHLSIVFFLFAVRRISGRPGNVVIGAVLAVSAAAVIWMSLSDPVDVGRVGVVWILFSYAVGVYLLIQAFRLARQERRRWSMLVPLLIVPVLVIHDVVGINNGGSFLADQLLSIYNPAFLALGLMLLFTARAREQIRELTTLNLELEQRVSEKHRQLEDNFAQMALLERREATREERERMVRDMHDGLGSQLTSTLAMVESGAYSANEVENALRDVLDDLRMMVHSMDGEVATLVDVLALVRERVEPRLKRQGMRFRWRVNPGNGDHPLPPETSGHVLRIVQEALANVVRHASANEIRIETQSDQGVQTLIIEDDGVGMGARAQGASGHGLRNMQERADLIGASFCVESPEEGGTRVRLVIPVEAPARV